MTTERRIFGQAMQQLPTKRGLLGRATGCIWPMVIIVLLLGLCSVPFYYGFSFRPAQNTARPIPLEQVQPVETAVPLKLDLIQATAFNTDTVAADSLLADLLQQQPPEKNRIIMLWSEVNLLGEEEESVVPLMVRSVEGDAFSASDMDGDIWICNAQTLKITDCKFSEWDPKGPNEGLAASASAILDILAKEIETSVKDFAANNN